MRTRVALGILTLVLLALLLLSTSSGRGQAAAPAQPIAFSHQIHAGQYKIDCQYCHSEARRSEYAGIPSVSRCMGCHKITAADRPEIQKLAAFFNRNEPIPWVRIFKVPEYVSFPHKPHVRAGVTCQACHGPIETMAVVHAKTGQNFVNDLLNLAGLARTSTPLTMGWCVECHTKMNAKDRTKAPLECLTCHH
ncbi:MAG: cytochrome C [Candidatus Rokubacteria bacterium]|nr:cytochrome C [Candidatus Rokubacteria bacterium]